MRIQSTGYSVKRYLLQGQKRPTDANTVYALQCQKRPPTVPKKTYRCEYSLRIANTFVSERVDQLTMPDENTCTAHRNKRDLAWSHKRPIRVSKET